ncbi:MAG TPA: tetratricopeptide repeat protein [Acidobacteriota bacterium]|nr:tetratricopeptide repeat protein [Acidobacteriota bacterium]
MSGDELTLEQLESLLDRKDLSSEQRLDVLDAIAGHYYDEDDYGKAIEYYRQAEEAAPQGNAKAYFAGQKGICHYLLEQDEKAYKALISAKEMFDEESEEDEKRNDEVYAMVLFFLGSYYEYVGDNDASLKTRLEALKVLDELDHEAQWMLLSGLSRNHERKGEHEKAIEYNMQAISLISDNDPELAYLYESMAANYFELGEYDEALTYYSKVLKADPQFSNTEQVHRRIAACYSRLLDYRMALQSYRKLLEIKKLEADSDESLAWLYCEIARCLYHLKEHRQALEAVREGLKQPVEENTELADLRSFLTSSNRHLGNHEEAVSEGQKTLKIASDFPLLEEMLPNLALSLYELDRLDQFEQYRQLCNKRFPDSGWTKHLNKLKV